MMNTNKRPMPQHPCRQNCPRRSESCASECPEWAEYVKIRNTEYERRGKERNVSYSYAHEVAAKIRKATGGRIVHRHG